jgi:hypothetical protein
MPVHIALPSRFLLLLVVAMVTATLGMVAYIYLPSATITIQPRTTDRTISQDIFLSSHTSEPDFARFVLPARTIERTVEETRRVQRQGLTTTDDFAHGSIVLVNEADEEQPLLPKTHLRHTETGEYFLTDTPVTIPPRSRVAMAITAKEKGAAGNVSPGRFLIDKLPESLQTRVYGESSSELSGGVIIESPLTEEEINQARDELMAAARERLRGELTLEAGGAPLRDDLIIIEVEEEKVSAEIGSKAHEFSLSRRVRARAFLVDENDLLSLTLLALRATVDPNEEFISYQPDSFKADVRRLDFERGEALVVGSLSGTYAAKIGPTILRGDNLAGLSADEIREHFAQHPAVGNVEISFSPFWVTETPSRPGAVEIALQEAH